MNIDLTGYRAWVGGSSQGIGKAVAIELANLGAEIILVARNAQNLTAVKNELSTSKNQHHKFLVADYANIEELKFK